MICKNQKEFLAEIKKYMDVNDIQMKELAIRMNKSQQVISQYFTNGNPGIKTIFQILDSLDLQIDINFVDKGDD